MRQFLFVVLRITCSYFSLGGGKKRGKKRERIPTTAQTAQQKNASCSWHETARTFSVSCLKPSPRPSAWGWQSRRYSHRDRLRGPTGFCMCPPEPSSDCNFSKEQPEVVASGEQILERTQCTGCGRPWTEHLVLLTLSAHGYKLHIVPGLLGAWPVTRHHKPLSRNYITYQTLIQF